MKNSRTGHLHSEVMEPKALDMVASVDTAIVIWPLVRTLMALAVMVATVTPLHPRLRAGS